MGHWLYSNRGHLIVFLFYLGIGSAFLASSLLYVVKLQEFSKSLVDPHNCALSHNDMGKVTTNTKNETTTTIVDCDLFKSWRVLGIVGTVYGGICLVAAVGKLFTVLNRFSPGRIVRTSTTEGAEGPSSGVPGIEIPMPPRSKGSLRNATGGPEIRRARQHVRRMIIGGPSKRRQEEEDVKSVMTLLGCLGICTGFLVVGFFWIVSIVLPLYIAWLAIVSEAIRVNDNHLYGASLTIFCLAIINLIFVTGSLVVMIMEAEEEIDVDVEQLGGQLLSSNGAGEEEEDEGAGGMTNGGNKMTE